MEMNKDIEKISITEEEIDGCCAKLAKVLSEDYAGKSPIFVGLLKGSVPFMANLIKYLEIDDMEIDFMDVSSYAGTTSTNNVRILKDLDADIGGKDVVIVEDIVDSGLTIKVITSLLKQRGANSVEVCSLLNKQSRRTVDVTPKYVGFEVENEFFVGYGLDYNEKYRQLPYIGVLKREVYMQEVE